jgi:hypothetical protein
VKIEAYREYLRERGISDDTIEEQMVVVGDFVEFLAGIGLEEINAAGHEEAYGFAQTLIADGRNTLENFTFLRSYADWLGHRELYVALLELMDCHNALEVLAGEIEGGHSREVRDRIFDDPLPPLGADEGERCAYTQAMMARMAQQITSKESRAAWFQVQHGIPAFHWHESDRADRETYRQCGEDIDEFLALKRRERDDLLTRLCDEGKLWYTIEINDKVLQFIKSDPEMEGGRREGNKVYITKVPYKAARYLDEADPKMKRYYACHCPLVREAILRDEPISPHVCYCSLGHASHYLAGLGQELEGEVLESAVLGDTRCRFVFYLPSE